MRRACELLFLAVLALVQPLRVQPAAPSTAILTTPGGLTLGVQVLSDGTIGVCNFSFIGAGARTTNLAPSPLAPSTPANGAETGGTLLAPSGDALGATPRCGAGCVLSGNGSVVTVTGLTLSPPAGGVLASEDWELRVLNDTSLAWRVTRVYARAAALAHSRFALALSVLGGGAPIWGAQIPSWVDLDMFLNESSTGGFATGAASAQGPVFQYLSPNSRQALRFAPTGALFSIDLVAASSAQAGGGGGAVAQPALFSFGKPFQDGTALMVSLGFELVDPRGAPRAVAAGATETLTLTLVQLAGDAPVPAGMLDPFPTLPLALPNATLLRQMATLAATQFQLNGWLSGNNPASVHCLHEVAWTALLPTVFGAGSPALAALQRQLSFLTRCGWQPSAYNNSGPFGNYIAHSCSLADGAAYGLSQRYSSAGFYQCPWGPLQDENVMLPIAVYYAAAAGGDRAWLASMRPALDAVAAYLASRGLAAGARPAVFTSPATGLPDGGRHSSNWFDVVEVRGRLI